MMTHTFWFKQTTGQPLFPDLLWSRPEHKAQARKLLIIGGNLHGFAAPAEAYVTAVKAGAGTVRILLPDSVKKIAGQVLETVDYASSTPSGSFSQEALGICLEHASWADGVLLAGDFGRNSETAILLEKFVSKYMGPLIITKDAADYFLSIPLNVLERSDTTLVLTIAELQKMGVGTGLATPILFSMDLLQLVDSLHFMTTRYPANLVVKHLGNVFVASNGKVSTTKLEKDLEIWRVSTAAKSSVWLVQNAAKPFEALTTSIIAD